MRAKNLYIIIISLILCLSLASCGLLNPSAGEQESDSSVAESSETATEPSIAPTYLSLYENEAGVRIIYPQDASSEVVNLASGLSTSLKKMGIAEHKATTERDDYKTEEIEIVLGYTKYAESVSVYATLGYGEARACVEGNKIILAAFDTKGLEKAIELFKYEINDCKDEAGGLRILNNWSESVITNETVAALPVLSGAVPSAITDSGDGSYTVSFKSLDRSTFESYIAGLKANGFELYTENSIENNNFYTYFKGEQEIYAIYLENTKTAKIMIAPKSITDTSILKPDASYVKGDREITFTQLGLTYAADHEKDAGTKHPDADYYTSGMSYVIRLDDGSFIIIDGGYDKQGDADRLYETMVLQSGSENIKVAAWIFTHMHSDHVEVFTKFAKSYSDKVTIERFIYNRPGSGQIGSHTDSFSKIRPYMEQYYSNVPRIKAVAGQKFFIRSCEIEILYSYDISQSALKNYNNSSLVFTLKAEGKQIMILGDYSEAGPILNKIYTSDTLKSDVVQVAHHGISDGNDILNRMIAADYAFWPVSALKIRTEWESNPTNVDLSTYFFNSYYMSMDPSRVFISGDDVVVMRLSGDIEVDIYDNFSEYITPVAQ